MHKLLAPLVGAFLFCTPASAGWLDPYDPNAPIVQPDAGAVVKPPRYNQQHYAPTPPKRVHPRPVVKPVAPVFVPVPVERPAPVVIPIEVPKIVMPPVPPVPEKTVVHIPLFASWVDVSLATLGGGVVIGIALLIIGLFASSFYRGFMAARKGKQ